MAIHSLDKFHSTLLLLLIIDNLFFLLPLYDEVINYHKYALFLLPLQLNCFVL